MPNTKPTALPEELFIEGLGVAPAGVGVHPTTVTSSSASKAAMSSDRDVVRSLNLVGNGDRAAVSAVHARSLSGHDDTMASAAVRLLDSTGTVDRDTIYCNLWLFIWLKTIGSFDSGAFSAALGAPNGISEAWELSTKLQGALTSSVFLGNVLGCPLAGHLFSRYDEKRVLCAALIVHAVFTFLYAALPVYGVALLNRFFIGISLSFIVVYTPVWVDEFAPKSQQSVWMASHNAGVPLGIMLGYLLAAGPQAFTSSISWSWSFYVKCILMVPTIAYVARLDPRSINTRKAGVASDGKVYDDAGDDDRTRDFGAVSGVATSGEGSNNAPGAIAVSPPPATASARASVSAAASRSTGRDTSTSQSLRMLADRALATIRNLYSSMSPLFSNVVYICSVVSLTSLYFVATGLQNFVTQYLRDPPFNASIAIIMVGFGSAVVSAPVCGVIVGGILLDRIGGYKRNLRRVAFFILAWGLCAVLFSVICIFVRTARGFLLVMSVVLFCGGAIIPPAAGLTMSSLPDHLRSVGAAFSQTIYNLLGNFSGPLVCGLVADATGSLRYGIITLLLSSTLGVVPILGMLYVAFYGAGNGLGSAASVMIGSSGDDGAGGAAEVVALDEEEEEEVLEMHSCGLVASEGGAMAAARLCRHSHDRGTAKTLTDAMAVNNGNFTLPPTTASVRSNSAVSVWKLQTESPPQLCRLLAVGHGMPNGCRGPAACNEEVAAPLPLPNRSRPSSPQSMEARPLRLPPSFEAASPGAAPAPPLAISPTPTWTKPAVESPAALSPSCAARSCEMKAELKMMDLQLGASRVMSLASQRALGVDPVSTWFKNEMRELSLSQRLSTSSSTRGSSAGSLGGASASATAPSPSPCSTLSQRLYSHVECAVEKTDARLTHVCKHADAHAAL
ncbi:hypothetical protein LSCM1_02946 [Leishmania martiniquensis]|uniref:Major facilitator superfamily (MFS) profile domain-containing protein n=1 Tax=Leishmania martiniquensis TaxID=1580590 RepID=A0A836HM13_9TRYP|nr:hypothetical protein LSCM1_02946 [Leishmania martiniquensis]